MGKAYSRKGKALKRSKASKVQHINERPRRYKGHGKKHKQHRNNNRGGSREAVPMGGEP